MLIALLLVFLCSNAAGNETETMTGWISEENCKAQHTEPGGKVCVKKCLRGGAHVGHPEWTAQKMVFIDEKDSKSLLVQNPDALHEYAGERVIIEAEVSSDGSLNAKKVIPYHPLENSALFEFHNGIWINLHHYLRGVARRELHPESKSKVTLQVSLDLEEQKIWNECVEYYKRYAEKDLIFDAELRSIKDGLGDAGNQSDLPQNKHPELSTVLKKAEPVYRKHWWPEHQKSNQDWITVAQRLVNQFGSRIAPEVVRAYDQQWPKEPVPVHVTIEAGWSGAYTTDDPVRITIASAEDRIQDYAALEILFHEASHAWGKEISDAIEEISKKQKVTAPENLWHALIFYTAGEITRRELKNVGIQNYVPYAYRNGLYERGWKGEQCAVETYWLPHLSDENRFQSSLERLIQGLAACESKTKSN